MILVADSGSTKTDWRLIKEDGSIQQLESSGLNPYFHTEETVAEEIAKTFTDQEFSQATQIFFYGSGSSSSQRKQIVESGLKRHFKKAKITVSHDLLGAARAACGHQAGLAGINGTGSNCCVFNGSEIIDSFPSGGYSIGDEGGGVNLGRRLLKAYIEEYLPADLRQKFDHRYKTDVDEILVNLYKKPYPNRYMANFSRFMFQNKEHPFISKLLLEEFDAYFDHQVLRFDQAKELPLNLVGSIAFYYHEYIKEVASNKGVTIGTILEKPISGLSLYHQEELGKQ
jgi:N-acetylglucosamine kinase-like BadF-type ATPase